jgi:hypothetical protein
MDPRDFNQVGVDILVRRAPTGAAAYRSAISRAYYAALNLAADNLTGIGHSPGKRDSKHKRPVIYLQQSGDAGLKRAGDLIDELRTMRNHADYDMMNTTVETPVFARDMVESAQQAIDDLDEFAAVAARKTSAAVSITRYRTTTRT